MGIIYIDAWRHYAETGDPYFDYVSLLLHCEGEDYYSVFTDSSSNMLETYAASATTSTTQVLFGDSSGYWEGGYGEGIVYLDDALFQVGAGSFTLEMSVRFSDSGTARTLLNYAGGTGTEGMKLWKTSGNVLMFSAAAVGAAGVTLTGATSLSADTWYAVAIVRDGNDWELFVNGASDASGSWSGTVGVTNSANSGLYIGRTFSAASSNAFAGHMDEFRFTKGVARYTAPYTIAAAPFPDA